MTFEEAHNCIKRGDIASLIRSLDSGLDPNLSNQFSWTLLMLAAVQGNTVIGRELVSRGADVNAANNFGECALSLAAQKGHVTFANWLLDAGATTRCRPHGWDLSD
jgi:ankyrin repeat protein